MLVIPQVLRDAFIRSDDYGVEGDAWGVVTEWEFAVAELIHHLGDRVPARWEYRHGAGECDFPETVAAEDLVHAWEQATDRNAPRSLRWGLPELVHFGDVLVRYSAILRAEGRDY